MAGGRKPPEEDNTIHFHRSHYHTYQIFSIDSMPQGKGQKTPRSNQKAKAQLALPTGPLTLASMLRPSPFSAGLSSFSLPFEPFFLTLKNANFWNLPS